MRFLHLNTHLLATFALGLPSTLSATLKGSQPLHTKKHTIPPTALRKSCLCTQERSLLQDSCPIIYMIVSWR